jgi:hypothetical protein
MNIQTFSVILFPILFCMVIVWFVLLKLFFNRLERAHPQKYEAMGRPSLFLRNNISGGWTTLKFLFTREYKTLNDGYLTKLSDAMLIFISIYLLLFFGLAFGIFGQVPQYVR